MIPINWQFLSKVLDSYSKLFYMIVAGTSVALLISEKLTWSLVVWNLLLLGVAGILEYVSIVLGRRE